MLKIAIVEKEPYAKNIIFLLSKIMKEEFVFTYYEKISELVKDKQNKQFDLFILNEAYNNIRIHDALAFSSRSAVIIYVQNEPSKKNYTAYSRIFNIYIENYMQDLEDIAPLIELSLKRSIEFYFSYNGIKLILKYHDVYFVEKQGKYMQYHTKKGVFQKRQTVQNALEKLEPFDFILINAGMIVNFEYIYRINGYDLELTNKETLTISRTKRRKVDEFIRSKVKLVTD